MDWVTAPGFTGKLRWKKWYQALADLSTDERWTFMNYGFASLEEPLEWTPLNTSDAWNQYPAQLYRHLYSKVEMRGRDVLDICSGRGGGASHAARYFAPRSVTGVDYSEAAVALCRRIHDVPNLQFQVADAEMLPFEDASFDVVSNVEASHCFPRFDRFARSVARVLRPGGHFVFADFREIAELVEVRAALQAAGLSFVSEADITINVTTSLDLERERREAFENREIPQSIRAAFEACAAGTGTPIRRGFDSGAVRYFAMHLQKST